MANAQTVELIGELETTGNPVISDTENPVSTIKGGKNQGTYVCKELVASGKRFRLKFLGLNEVRSGKPHVIEVYRVNHSPASMSLIGDEFQGMEFTAKVEKDATKVGTGLSQYMVIKDVE